MDAGARLLLEEHVGESVCVDLEYVLFYISVSKSGIDREEVNCVAAHYILWIHSRN